MESTHVKLTSCSFWELHLALSLIGKKILHILLKPMQLYPEEIKSL
ncbi:hypothetical protein [[Scytonema hofmanni] UTEX B 1581]|nr:hypothetical protein [[Scytonema hofmanni] UTEX B 1581]